MHIIYYNTIFLSQINCRYGSHQNQIVADFLVTQIKTEHGDQFSVEHIKSKPCS